MKAYRVTITETRTATFYVVADDDDQATDLALAEDITDGEHEFDDRAIDSVSDVEDLYSVDEPWLSAHGYMDTFSVVDMLAEQDDPDPDAPPEPFKLTIPMPLDTP